MKLVSVYRIRVYIPPEYLEILMKGVKDFTDLDYGEYKGVYWQSSAGVESFVPGDSSCPTHGKAGVTEQVDSVCVHFSVPMDKRQLKRLIKDIIIPIHPWEEPVITVSEALETRAQG